MGSPHRIFGLDLLRAIAILSVVFGHGYVLTDRTFSDETYSIPVLDGVAMFFVLSGFLIGRILLRTIAEDDFDGRMLLRFWIRRWFRTIPNYLLVLVIIITFYHVLGLPQPEGLLKYFSFSQNISTPHPAFYPEAWSLTVEEWFYLIVPLPIFLVIMLTKIDRRKAILIWIGAVIVSVTVFRIYRVQHVGYSTFSAWDDNLRKQVVTRLDSLMFGVLAAYLSIYKVTVWRCFSGPGFWLGLCVLLFNKFFWYATHSMFYLNYFNLTLTSVGTFLILPKMSNIERRRGWLVVAVTSVSLISYSMYLINLTLVQLLILPLVVPFLVSINGIFREHIYITQYFTYWFLTLSGSAILYLYFERPMTAIRERFYVRGHKTPTAFAEHEPKLSL